MNDHPHFRAPVLTRGPAAAAARTAVLLLHGRALPAEGMLDWFDAAFPVAAAEDQVLRIAPEADGRTWYPLSFLAPLADNEPHLSAALRRLAALVDGLREQGLGSERLLIAGFSQGAALASEFVARHPARYRGVAILTGGVIGPPGTAFAYPGSLAGTPVALGANDPDPFVPYERVALTADLLRALGAQVTLERYPRRPHEILPEHTTLVRRLLHPD